MIILESAQEGALDLLDLDFVARLAEHASPAIVNAQLFQELTRANEARSEFVSIVAHELKNPMTSMPRLYRSAAEGRGRPGPTSSKADFLNTIFSKRYAHGDAGERTQRSHQAADETTCAWRSPPVRLREALTKRSARRSG